MAVLLSSGSKTPKKENKSKDNVPQEDINLSEHCASRHFSQSRKEIARKNGFREATIDSS
jgi:hypothetical protein